jgi:ABC-type transport system involved in multi-copper enzyme maturation permease subunit
MSKAIAIAQREIQERAFVLVVAAAATAVPFLVPFMPWERGTLSERMAEVNLVGDVITAGYVLTLAALLGASIVGRELREKRLSFYFARPVSGSAIWFGKMIASLFLLAASATILSLPPTLLVRNAGRNGWWTLSTPALIGIVMVIGFSLLLFVHAAATMLRSRSPLIAVDFVAAVAFVAILGYLLLPIVLHNAVVLFGVVVLSTFLVVVLTLLFAGAWQLSRGRIDPRRGHHEMSLFIWSTLAVVILALVALTSWIAAVEPNDLQERYPVQAGDGAAVLVAGPAKHRLDYRAAFLTDVARGSIRRVSPFARWNLALSGDGRTAMWFEPYPWAILDGEFSLSLARRPGTFKLVAAHIGDSSRAIDTGIDITRRPDAIALTNDGSRVAIYAGEMLTVYDVARGKSIGTARVPASGAWNARVQFNTPDDVRVYSATTGGTIRLSAHSFALKGHALRQLLDYTTAGRSCWYTSSADGTRLLARINRVGATGLKAEPSLALFDLTSGRLLYEIPQSSYGWLFRDGRLGAISQNEGNLVAKLYDSNGTAIREVNVAASSHRERIVGEIEPGVLAVATSGASLRNGRGWRLSRVDLNTGTVTPIATEVAPVLKFPFGVGTTPPGAGASQPMIDANGDLVAIDLRTGARRKLP